MHGEVLEFDIKILSSPCNQWKKALSPFNTNIISSKARQPQFGPDCPFEAINNGYLLGLTESQSYLCPYLGFVVQCFIGI